MSTTVLTNNIPVQFGAGTRYRKFTIDWDAFKAIIGAATSGNVPLFTLPQAGLILYCKVIATVQFAGVGGTFKVSVGTTGTATLITAASADLVATAIAVTTFTEGPSAAKCLGSNAAVGLVVNAVSTVGNINTLTAGSVDVYVLSVEPSEPGA